MKGMILMPDEQGGIQAYKEGRKIRTSRPIKCKYDNTHIQWLEIKYGKQLVEMQNDVEGETFWKNPDGSTTHKLLACREIKPYYRLGDIGYWRETWAEVKNATWDTIGFAYRADEMEPDPTHTVWRPSIHMPREAARYFWRVTDVRVQRLEDVTEQDAVEDGFYADEFKSARAYFEQFWVGTYPRRDWMFAYYFEPITKEEALRDAD